MTKGTASQGRRSGRTSHIYCRRCGSKSYHVSRSVCAACGYGKTAKMRKYSWQSKVN